MSKEPLFYWSLFGATEYIDKYYNLTNDKCLRIS